MGSGATGLVRSGERLSLRLTKMIFFRSRRAFTMIEVLVASAVGIFVIMSAIAVFLMAWRWWSETYPRIEAQQITRLAISRIVNGVVDTTAGQDVIIGATHTRRNGIAGADRAPDTATAGCINFSLEPDGSNLRSYYIASDDQDASRNAVYYSYDPGSPTVTKIRGTTGITGLSFVQSVDEATGFILVTVTATVDRNILGTRQASYNIHVEYSDSIYIRNYRP